jgi:hypothetical protein
MTPKAPFAHSPIASISFAAESPPIIGKESEPPPAYSPFCAVHPNAMSRPCGTLASHKHGIHTLSRICPCGAIFQAVLHEIVTKG